MPEVICIIVAYRPDIVRLTHNVSKLILQFGVVVVSNIEDQEQQSQLQEALNMPGCIVICLGDNYGIGRAQNVGIQYALGQKAEYVLLLDDDSTIENEAIALLRHHYSKLVASGRKVCAVCPVPRDRSTGKLLVGGLRLNNEYSLVRDLMSSGSLISSMAFNEVGFKDESLFIDCVDFDWGWRAIRLGYEIVIVNDVVIAHKLGISSKRFLFDIELRIPSPVRHYYQYRNVFCLAFSRRSPVGWSIRNVFRLLLKIPLYLLVCDRKRVRLRYILLGFYHFIICRSGKI